MTVFRFMKKLFLNDGGVFKGIVVYDENNIEIGKITYPKDIPAAEAHAKGTDTFRSAAGRDVRWKTYWIGKVITNGQTILTKEGEGVVYSKFLTGNEPPASFKGNNFLNEVKIGGVNGKIVFTCTQIWKPFFPHIIKFEKDSMKFVLEKKNLFSSTFDLKVNDKIVGSFSPLKFISALPETKYVGDDSLTNEEIIYLYAISRPNHSG